MKKSEDPDKYFDKLAVLKNKYKHCPSTFDDKKMIAATIAKALSTYGSVITGVLCDKGDKLTLEDLQAALKEYWRIKHNLIARSNATNDDEDSTGGNSGSEVALFGTSELKKIKGRCYYCGKPSHMANQCPKKKNGKMKGFKRGQCRRGMFKGT